MDTSPVNVLELPAISDEAARKLVQMSSAQMEEFLGLITDRKVMIVDDHRYSHDLLHLTHTLAPKGALLVVADRCQKSPPAPPLLDIRDFLIKQAEPTDSSPYYRRFEKKRRSR